MTGANHCNTFGIDSIGTKAFDRNVSGNTTTNPIPITASGDRTSIPRNSPHQTTAEANMTSSNEARRNSATEVCGRHPTSSPVPRRTTIDNTSPASSAM
ncbi:MAG: hypothetical protein R2715_12090 [Ilumatobacteraceae bacterium]